MSEQTRQQVTIAVDLKKYRIRIHRSTLTLLGTPKYVQFLVSPSAMMLAIQGTDKRTNPYLRHQKCRCRQTLCRLLIPVP